MRLQQHVWKDFQQHNRVRFGVQVSLVVMLGLLFLGSLLGPTIKPAQAAHCSGWKCAFKSLVPGSTLISRWGDCRPLNGNPCGTRHQGVDLQQAKGSPIYSIENGVITSLGVDALGGNVVYLRDTKGRLQYLAHLIEIPRFLHQGQVIHRGDLLGNVGNSGDARYTVSHLHFQITFPHGGWANPQVVLAHWPN
jgi:murein DD-endopeptidase MepM/ murein hydrolase activator NlpD